MEDLRKSYESTPEYENVMNFLSVECEKKKVCSTVAAILRSTVIGSECEGLRGCQTNNIVHMVSRSFRLVHNFRACGGSAGF